MQVRTSASVCASCNVSRYPLPAVSLNGAFEGIDGLKGSSNAPRTVVHSSFRGANEVSLTLLSKSSVTSSDTCSW